MPKKNERIISVFIISFVFISLIFLGLSPSSYGYFNNGYGYPLLIYNRNYFGYYQNNLNPSLVPWEPYGNFDYSSAGPLTYSQSNYALGVNL